jgi:hypothetical protein
LITNSDDSYRLNDIYLKDFKIVVERNETKTGVSFIDQAGGMSYDEMVTNLLTVGSYTASDSSRGMMGRGAKDCSFLGDVFFTCIKNDKLNQLVIYQNMTAEFLISDENVSDSHRKDFEITKNGTNVRINVANGLVPPISKFHENLKNNIYLRNLFQEPNTIVIAREDVENFNERIIFKFDPRKLIVSCDYDVPEYDTTAHLELYRFEEEMDYSPSSDRIKYGISVCSSRSVFENSALYYSEPGIQDYIWNQNIRYVSGFLRCDKIEKMARDAIDGKIDSKNPYLILDPNRRNGLVKDHPFTKALFASGYQLLDIIMNKMQDYKDDELLENGNANDVLNSLSNFLDDILPQEEYLYTWRTKKDHENLVEISNTIKNVNLDDDFLGLTWDEIQNLSDQNILQTEKLKAPRSNFNITFTNDPKIRPQYQVLYLPGKFTLKINTNDPSIKPFVSVENGAVNLVNPGKALGVVGHIVSEVSDNLIIRNNILNNKTSSLDINAYNEYIYNFNSTKIKIAPGIYQRILVGIKDVKSGLSNDTIPLS